MVYRTLCGCIASAPEPSISEYETLEEWECAHEDWADTWNELVAAHADICPDLERQIMSEKYSFKRESK